MIVLAAYLGGRGLVLLTLLSLAVGVAILAANAPMLRPNPPDEERVLDQACFKDMLGNTSADSISNPSLAAEARILCSYPRSWGRRAAG